MRSRIGRIALAAVLVALATAPAASAKVRVSFERLKGYNAPGTPAKYDKVGALKIGPKKARNVLILNPGTSASASYFVPLAKDIVTRTKGWQVWAVERRENLLEDQSMFNKAKAGQGHPAAGVRLLPAATSPTRASRSTSSRSRRTRSRSRASGG